MDCLSANLIMSTAIRLADHLLGESVLSQSVSSATVHLENATGRFINIAGQMVDNDILQSDSAVGSTYVCPLITTQKRFCAVADTRDVLIYYAPSHT